MNIAKNITDLIGNTPLVELNRLTEGLPGRVVAKLEFFNPGSSVKDRIAEAMIEAAEKEGKINKNTTNLTPTHTFYLNNNNTECVPHDAAKALKTIINHPHWNALKQKAIKGKNWENTLTTDYLTDTYWEQISTDYSDGYAWGVSYDLIIDYTIDYAHELKHLTNSTETQTPYSKNLTPKQQKQLTTMLNNVIKKLEQSEWYEPDPEDYTIPYTE